MLPDTVVRHCSDAKITRVPSVETHEESSWSSGIGVNGSQLVKKEGQTEGSQLHKSKASRQGAHHRGGRTRRHTPNASEASCRQVGPRIRGFGWQMRKMRRRSGQLQASPCIIRDELLQIGCCRWGVAKRTRQQIIGPRHARRDSLRPRRLLHLVKSRRRETHALAACWDVGWTRCAVTP